MYNCLIIDPKKSLTIDNVSKALIDFNNDALLKIVDGEKLEVLSNICFKELGYNITGKLIGIVRDCDGVNDENNAVASVISGLEYLPSKMVIAKLGENNVFLPLNKSEVERVYKTISKNLESVSKSIEEGKFSDDDDDSDLSDYQGINCLEIEIKADYLAYAPLKPQEGYYHECYPLFEIPCDFNDPFAPHFPLLEGKIAIDKYTEEQSIILSILTDEGKTPIELKRGEEKKLELIMTIDNRKLALTLNIAFKEHGVSEDLDLGVEIDTIITNLKTNDSWKEITRINELYTGDSEVYSTSVEEFIVDKVDKNSCYVRLFNMKKHESEKVYHHIPVYLGKENKCRFYVTEDGVEYQVDRTIVIKGRKR